VGSTAAIDLGVLISVGFTSGVVNAFAGGGSLLTLPVLLWMGLPAPVANASNRISLVMQYFAATTAFQRGGRLPWRPTLLIFVPALPGAILGADIAAEIDEVLFRRILMVVLICALWGLLRRRSTDAGPTAPRHPVLVALGCFAIGFYAGFLQAGLGLLLLTMLHTLGGFDLVRSNAIKAAFVFLLQVVALGIFGAHGQVDWGVGAALAIGSTVGAWAGAHWQMRRDHEWVRRAVVVILVLFAVRLGWEGFVH
jgi:hypothetical protein